MSRKALADPMNQRTDPVEHCLVTYQESTFDNEQGVLRTLGQNGEEFHLPVSSIAAAYSPRDSNAFWLSLTGGHVFVLRPQPGLSKEDRERAWVELQTILTEQVGR